MARWSPVPFVLGPLNGHLPWPSAFTAEQKRERERFSLLRPLARLMPYHRSTYARSAAVLAAFQHTLDYLSPETRARAINFPEVGIDPETFAPGRRPASERLTVLYAGRLVPYKLPEVVVRAFAASPALRRHRLLVVGDGPERSRLEALVAEHGLSDCVQLLGQKSQAEVGALMREAHVFAFPSIRELGAGVVVEAMACAMACVVVDYGGPADLVGPDRGVKVPMGTLDQLVERFTHELSALVGQPERVAALGARAHAHALAHYTWDAKARKTLEVYRWAIGQAASKPEFWAAPAAA
jgi:glycosyltransferase involved in cell wall biosynthesis